MIRRNLGDESGLKEAKLLTSLQHPNIVQIFAAVRQKQTATIVSEYLAGGSLNNQLVQEFKEYDFLKLACGMASALDFSHQNKILHSNLSPENILFDEKQNPKLSDFGQRKKQSFRAGVSNHQWIEVLDGIEEDTVIYSTRTN